jgi:modulator of FtsH protease HflC
LLHHHHHHHHHGPDHSDDGDRDHRAGRLPRTRRAVRFLVAGAVVCLAVLAACVTIVRRGEAVIITRLGDPIKVIAEPGLTFKMPAPIDAINRIDLRLHSLSSGLQDVGTKDGLRVLMQAYVVWRVHDAPEQLYRFLRAVRNDPDTAAAQLRSFTASTMGIAASRFDFASLVNTDRSLIRLPELEALLRDQLQAQVAGSYGVIVQQVGIERLTLPTEALAATVSRMRADRQTVAQQRIAEGGRVASEIRSGADRDARITVANAKVQAAEIEAKARIEAADIYGASYRANPDLYQTLRSLDTLDQVVSDKTRLILRTDSAPFRALVEKPVELKPGFER